MFGIAGLWGLLALSLVGAVLVAAAGIWLSHRMLFIVFWLDHPFGNQLGVTSEPFEQSQNAFDSIDRGT